MFIFFNVQAYLIYDHKGKGYCIFLMLKVPTKAWAGTRVTGGLPAKHGLGNTWKWIGKSAQVGVIYANLSVHMKVKMQASIPTLIIQEILRAHEEIRPIATPQPRPMSQASARQWRRSEEGIIKINCDAAWISTSGRGGGRVHCKESHREHMWWCSSSSVGRFYRGTLS